MVVEVDDANVGLLTSIVLRATILGDLLRVYLSRPSSLLLLLNIQKNEKELN